MHMGEAAAGESGLVVGEIDRKTNSFVFFDNQSHT